MTALAEKLKEAGADTIGAKFTAACVDALRRRPGNISAAWADVGASFGLEFIRSLQADMCGHEPASTPAFKSSFGGRSGGMGSTAAAPAMVPAYKPLLVHPEKPYVPRVIPKERIERKQQLRELVRSKFKTSANVSWSDVGWHELQAMKRDGVEAKALLAAGPASVPNDGRSVGDVLGVARTDEIVASVRNP